ncbi:MAG: hypothetical protein FJ290_07365 [Planctomycetes bacterium]|nr:hypothetical protein [Planctomycetota bacterium]
MPVALQVLLTSILSLPFSALDAWNAVATARLAARMKVVTDAGDPASMAELAKRYPDPPPGRNAAEHLNAAFKLMEAREEKDGPPRAHLPVVADGQLPAPNDPLPRPMLAAIQAYLKDNAEILDLLHKAAERQECKFDLDFTKGMGMLLPHLARLRHATRLLALEAMERIEAGKADDAGESLIAALRMGEALRREPILVSTLVRIACNSLAVAQAERWASRTKPSPAALERLEAALAAAADPKLIEGAMVGERCFGIDIYQTYILKPNRAEMLRNLGAAEVPFPLAVNLIPNAYFKMDMCYYLDVMNAYVAVARRSYPQNYLDRNRALEAIPARLAERYFIAGMILPALGRTFVSAQNHMARCESARVALAALRYKAKHGRLPADLAALVPGFLKAVPLDPFDGKPLRYKAGEAGLTVYALGENGKDDGGLTQPPPEGKPPDIGFRLRWPKAEF